MSLGRGILGMAVLIGVGYLCSRNRKAIQWKYVGIGLFIQLVLALSVLKITFIKNLFEFIGGIFVNILNFTKAGTIFLLGCLLYTSDGCRRAI